MDRASLPSVPNDERAVINLEHVLPKKPLGNWSQFTMDEAAVWVNRFGNQALMRASDNSDLQSNSFATKKEIYKDSPYVLTSQMASSRTGTRRRLLPDRLRLRSSLSRLGQFRWFHVLNRARRDIDDELR
jgi:hypothetical protein